jgi:hypothetical protein
MYLVNQSITSIYYAAENINLIAEITSYTSIKNNYDKEPLNNYMIKSFLKLNT